MKKAYRILKFVLLGLAIVYLIFIVVFEAAYSDEPADSGKFIIKITKPYVAFKKFMEADPYNKKILTKTEQFEKSVNDFFTDRMEAIAGMMQSRAFTEEMFSFVVFGKVSDMNPLVYRYFGAMTDFKDLIIIDQEKNIIYKYGSESFSIRYYPDVESVALIDYGSLYGIVSKQKDETLNYEYEVIAFFNYEGLRALMYESPFPSFVAVNDKVIVNDRFSPSLYTEHRENIEAGRKSLLGFKFLKPFEVVVEGVDFGYAGSIYPVRTILSYLLILLKVAIVGAVVAALYFIDRLIRNLLGRMELNKDEQAFVNPVAVQKTAATPETTDEDNLVWIKNYIRETEEKK